MDTCLDSLWELIRNPISDIINDAPAMDRTKLLQNRFDRSVECSNVINEFFSNLSKNDFLGKQHQFNMPEHLSCFVDLLNKYDNISVEGLKAGVVEAKELTEKCGLCSVCRGCASQFYKDIIKGKISEKSLPFSLENYFMNRSQMFFYNSNMQHKNEMYDLKNKLLCLKGFSSSTPTIHSIAFNSNCSGGGLYLNYNGIGIAIDPGIGFVNSMHKNGIYINNIHIVIITHDHLDHNSDAELISSLSYDFNNYVKRKNKLIEEKFGFEKTKTHTIKWLVDDSTAKKLKGKVSGITKLSEFVDRKKQMLPNNAAIKLSAIRTNHIKDSEDSFGLKVLLDYNGNIFSIGYTSDTSYFDDLAKFVDGSDLVVFNVSDIYKKDVKGIKDKHSHLGYNGSLKLLKNVSTKLAIASEFCCTNGDFRMNFINTIKTELPDVKLIPGEIGLTISIPDATVECSICKGKNVLSDVNILAPKKDFEKIQYICRHCMGNML